MTRQLVQAFIFCPTKSSSLNKKPTSFTPTQTSNGWFNFLLLILVLFTGQIIDIHAAAHLPVIGGTGGGQFIAPCPQEQNLTGFELRNGDDVDAIKPLCVTSYGPSNISAPILTVGSGIYEFQRVNGHPFMKVVEGWYGGPGGQISRLLCPANTPIVLGIFVGAEGVDTIVVNNIHLYCGLADSNQQQDMYPSAIFDGPGYKPSPAVLGIGSGGKQADQRQGQERCPAGQVAVGVHGRAGEMIDAMGLICDGPRISNARLLGRVKTTTATTSSTTAAPPKSVCDSARAARARNSPTAPGLEAQCKAELAKMPMLEGLPAKVQNPALKGLVPNVKNVEATETDPNNLELDWPMR